MLRRTPIKSRARREWEAQRASRAEREPKPPHRLERPVSYIGTTTGPAPKTESVRHEGYRRLVAAMPCKHCGIHGYSQAAHPNTNKGAGLKTDDRECFALCTVHPVGGGLVTGCHELFDQGALFTKAVRREIEPAWGADTRAAIRASGQWPADLPEWEEK